MRVIPQLAGAGHGEVVDEGRMAEILVARDPATAVLGQLLPGDLPVTLERALCANSPRDCNGYPMGFVGAKELELDPPIWDALRNVQRPRVIPG